MSLLDDFPKEEDLKKTIMLTNSTAWKVGLTNDDIESWLSNFQGEILNKMEERVIALWLLANFTYFTENEVRHLCRVLLRKYIHASLVEEHGANKKISEEIQELLSETAFISLGQSAESGAFVLYFFRQTNNLHLSYFPTPENAVYTKRKKLVYLDDVTLTPGMGGQAYKYLAKITSNTLQKMLLTFVSSGDARSSIESLGVKVISAIDLDKRNKCFEKQSAAFNGFDKYRDAARRMTEHYGVKIEPKRPLGYQDSQLLIGFFYNTPDNSLPIFWSSRSNWKPIFKRYDKNYYQKKVTHGEFV